MKIPNKVRVGSVDYTVNSKDERQILNSQQCYGMIDYVYHTIDLDNGIQDNQKLEITFLHELVHAIFSERSVDLVYLGLCNEQMETVVDELAKGLHQVIRDNPSIFCSCKKETLKLDGKIIAENLEKNIRRNLVNKGCD